MAYSKLGQQERAIADLSAVLELNPDHVNALFARLVAIVFDQFLWRALYELLFDFRAACFNSIGQFSRAIEDYNVALLKDQVRS